MTGMLDDTEIDAIAILQGIGGVLVQELGYAPNAVIILHAPDGQCRTLFAANPETVFADGSDARRTLRSILEQAVKQNRSIPASAPRRL